MEGEILFMCATVALCVMLAMAFRLYQLSEEVFRFYETDMQSVKKDKL